MVRASAVCEQLHGSYSALRTSSFEMRDMLLDHGRCPVRVPAVDDRIQQGIMLAHTFPVIGAIPDSTKFHIRWDRLKYWVSVAST